MSRTVDVLNYFRARMDRTMPGWRAKWGEGKLVGRIDVVLELPDGTVVTGTVHRAGGFEGERIQDAPTGPTGDSPG